MYSNTPTNIWRVSLAVLESSVSGLKVKVPVSPFVVSFRTKIKSKVVRAIPGSARLQGFPWGLKVKSGEFEI